MRLEPDSESQIIELEESEEKEEINGLTFLAGFWIFLDFRKGPFLSDWIPPGSDSAVLFLLSWGEVVGLEHENC
jgi:hypothetical protein